MNSPAQVVIVYHRWFLKVLANERRINATRSWRNHLERHRKNPGRGRRWIPKERNFVIFYVNVYTMYVDVKVNLDVFELDTNVFVSCTKEEGTTTYTGWWISRGDLLREISPSSSRGRQLPWCRDRDDGSQRVTEPFITSIYQRHPFTLL